MSQTIYFGTYTKKNPKEFTRHNFDPVTGTLNHLELVVAEPNPTYIAFSKKGNLYSVGAEEGKGESLVLQPIFSRSITSSKRGSTLLCLCR